MDCMAYLDFILFSKEGDMIGKPEWFQRRKYGGWGLHPKDWRGWVYILAFAIPIIVFQAIPIWNLEFRLVITGIWALILIIDTIDLFIKLKKDEREKIHEAIAERNAMWTISAILAIGIAFQVAVSAVRQQMLVDYWLIAALVSGLIVKAMTNYYLDRKD